MRRPTSCGACGVTGHTIRTCPNKLVKVKEQARRLRFQIDNLAPEHPLWIWRDLMNLMNDIQAIGTISDPSACRPVGR